MDKISIVIPCFNEEDSVVLVYEALDTLSKEMVKQEFEYLFIDDGSTDNTLKRIADLSTKDSRIKYFSFSRNFGKEAAMYSGLVNASGNFIAIIDADLQDPPNLIKEMYLAIIEEEFDCVAAIIKNRVGEPRMRSAFAKVFYKIINKISDVSIKDGARDFRLMKKEMVDAILTMTEYNRFSKGIFGWVGFDTKWIEYNSTERIAGKTKWSFWKLFLYATDGIVAFSTKPLAIASYGGLLLCALSFILICVIVLRTLIFGDPVAGWPSLICIIMFIGGIQLFSIGILGQYLAKTYLETKKRPIFIVKKSNVVGNGSKYGFIRENKQKNDL